MPLTGKRVDQFSVEATQVNDNDFFGISQDVGAGVFQTRKLKRSRLTNIKVISRSIDAVRLAGAFGPDSEIFFDVVAGLTYYIRSRLLFSIVPNGVVDYSWSTPALTSAFQNTLYTQTTTIGVQVQRNNSPILIDVVSSAPSNFLFSEDGLVLIPAADGTVSLDWSALVNTVTFTAGSWIEVNTVTP